MVLAKDPSFKDCLARRREQHFNHTAYTPICLSPIAISVETKPVAGNYDEARGQLGIWAYAHFARLRQLCGKTPEFLPLLVVMGNKWSFLAATQEVEEGPSGVGGLRTMVWGEIKLGDSCEMYGICQIIAALRELATWAAQDFKQWLLENLA